MSATFTDIRTTLQKWKDDQNQVVINLQSQDLGFPSSTEDPSIKILHLGADSFEVKGNVVNPTSVYTIPYSSINHLADDEFPPGTGTRRRTIFVKAGM